jgi:HemY protein
VQGWLARALTAPRGPQWVCENCSNIHAEWAPTCTNCGAFDTLVWSRPSDSEIDIRGRAELRPLLVGKPDVEEGPAITMLEDMEIIETRELDNTASKEI